MNLNYQCATIGDAALLTGLTLKFADELVGPIDEELRAQFEAKLLTYYPYAIDSGIAICWYALAAGEPVGMASINIREQYPTLKNLSGKMGYLFNVFTLPDHRGMGIASTLVNCLLDAAKQQGITAFELHATPDGEPVYVKQGFMKHAEPTYRMYN